MTKNLIVGLFLCLTAAPEPRAECPPSWPTASEQCLAASTPDVEADDVVHSYENLLQACNHYNATINCIDKLIDECMKSDGDVTQGLSIRQKMLADFQYICGNNDTFIKFQKYSECFGEVAKESAKCQENVFTDGIYEYMYTENDGYDYRKEPEYGNDENICQAMKQLLTCINDIVLAKCGVDAVELYDHMVVSQLPSHITEACPEMTSSARLTSPTALIYAPLLVSVCLSGFS